MDILKKLDIDFTGDLPRKGTCINRLTGDSYNFTCNCGHFISTYMQSKLVEDMIPKDEFIERFTLSK